MDKFLKELEKELKNNRLYQSEIDEVLSYYEEMITERFENGESMDKILSSYDVKLITRMFVPQTLSKRKLETNKEVTSSVWLLVLFLFSIPVLIPIGVMYVVFLVVVLSLIISAVAVGITGIVGFIALILKLGTINAGAPVWLVSTGAYLIGITIGIIVLYFLIMLFGYIVKGSYKFVSKLISRGRNSWKIL